MRLLKGLCGLCLFLLIAGPVHADWRDALKSAVDGLGSNQPSASSSDVLSNDQIIKGLKEALAIGTEKAVDILGQSGGFLNDQQVKIPLPDTLETIGKGLRAVGQDELVDDFVVTMNRAAERAVPETLEIFSQTIREMSLQDAKGILDGGDSAATDYFRQRGGDRLAKAILPIVKEATEEAGVTSAYKALVGKAGFMAQYLDMSAADLDQYVTGKALDGLFLKLAEQERLIRKDPVARTTDILKTVFGQ